MSRTDQFKNDDEKMPTDPNMPADGTPNEPTPDSDVVNAPAPTVPDENAADGSSYGRNSN